MQNNYTVFVSSSDNYSDIWDVFFDMFYHFWPDFQGKIVLNTQEKTYHHKHLKIICTQVGKRKYFGETFLAGLEKVKTNNVLLMMIDYMFMGGVNVKTLDKLYNFFISENLDSLCLFPQSFINSRTTSNPQVNIALPPGGKILFGFQIAFWKRQVLNEMVLPHENPWMAEWFGCERAAKMKIRLGFLREKEFMPIPYDARGCLHQGKWLANAITQLKGMDYNVDFSRRGKYEDTQEYTTIRFRIKLKYWIWSTGLKGSYWDLLWRKPIH